MDPYFLDSKEASLVVEPGTIFEDLDPRWKLRHLSGEEATGRKKQVIVGWYHSHPSYTCFMSATDIQTQRAMFDRRFHTAIVIDPLNKEIDAFYLENERVETRPFAVYWDMFQNPYYGRTVRMRQLDEKPVPPG